MIINSTKELGNLIKSTRKSQGLTQTDLAAAAGVGIRFIVDLENGKETAQLGKTLNILMMLGLKVNVGE
jgi:HTH-type transcriptional regulator/antitoxin HipB